MSNLLYVLPVLVLVAVVLISRMGQKRMLALNQLSSAAVGVSTYVPQVRIGLTSSGRVLVAREYSDLGERGDFKQIAAFGPGTRALDAATADPGQELKAPLKNPMGGGQNPEFVQFRSPSGEIYEAWMAGGQVVGGGFVAAFHDLCAKAASGSA